MKRTKIALLAITLAITSSLIVHADEEEFNRGYQLGWEEGYHHMHGQLSIAPICPIPPIPQVGEDTFFGGYNAGFLAVTGDERD